MLLHTTHLHECMSSIIYVVLKLYMSSQILHACSFFNFVMPTFQTICFQLEFLRSLEKISHSVFCSEIFLMIRYCPRVETCELLSTEKRIILDPEVCHPCTCRLLRAMCWDRYRIIILIQLQFETF